MIAGSVLLPIPGRTGGSGYILPPSVPSEAALLLESGGVLLLESGEALLEES